jgi:hypothetical protein
MSSRTLGVCSLAAVLVLGLQACKKSSPAADNLPAAEKQIKAENFLPVGDTLARIHWLGKKRIAADTNSASLMTVWKLPESVRLEQQTLDKLALAPSYPPKGIQATNYQPYIETNANAKLLRPLLEDLLQEESYLECRGPTNRSPDVVFGIRLDDGRAALWQTNLAQALELLTGIRALPAPDGKSWALRKHDRPNLVELTRSGGWTLVGLSEEKNELLSGLSRRLEHNPDSLRDTSTNSWFEWRFAMDRLAKELGRSSSLTAQIVLCSGLVRGEEGKVRTSGQIELASPLLQAIEPWDLPTNLVHEPLTSFIALQGFKPFLESLEAWKQINPSYTGNQAFFWSDDGAPFLNYMASPWPGASNDLSKIRDWWLQSSPTLIGTNFIGKFEPHTKGIGVAWGSIPFMSPYLQAVSPKNKDLIIGGFFPNPGTNPPSGELLQQLFSRTNLLMYDWEISDPRIEQYFDILQLVRIMFRKPQLPTDSVGLQWLKALNSHLGNAVTIASRADANRITFTRKSGSGFTALELHLLADWLESTQFPKGLFTTTGTNAPPAKRASTPPGVAVPRTQK